MFCNKYHVNLLTALLPHYGVRHVVACPGSRNAMLIHNFVEHTGLRIHPVTDERSAAFVALGIATACRQPVAVCVTSGSALLNTLPGVAEASFRHLPLVVISADRPPQWINQLDGQTLTQNGALLPYAPTYTLNEPADDTMPESEAAWWCRRTISEALMALHRNGGGPVHINVPVTEPLFNFTVTSLPEVSIIKYIEPIAERPLPDEVMTAISGARLPLLVVGQYEFPNDPAIATIEKNDSLLVIPELIGNQPHSRRMAAIEENPALTEALQPDLIVHIGGNLIGKTLKRQIRRLSACRVIRIAPDETCPDTFRHLSVLVKSALTPALRQLAAELPRHDSVACAKQLLEEAISAANGEINSSSSAKDAAQAKVMHAFARHIRHQKAHLAALHLANSTSVRTAAKCFEGGLVPVFCNRGVNGIEGSLSAAVGHALASKGLNLVFIGDLSFFYDQNALWNEQLPENLRIVLFNDGGGSIFHSLPGLDASPALGKYIAAAHHTTAESLAATYGLRYLCAQNAEEAEAQIEEVLRESGTALILEIFI